MERDQRDTIVALLPSSRMTLRELESVRNKMIAAAATCAEYCGMRFAAGSESTQTLLQAYATAIAKLKTSQSKSQGGRFANAKPRC